MKSRKFVSKDEIDEVALIRIVYRLSMTKGQGRDLREYSRVRVQMKPIRPLGVDISGKNRLRLSMTNLVTRVKAKRRGVKPSEHLRGSICSVGQVRLDGIYSSRQPAKGQKGMMWSAQKDQNWAAEVSRVSLFWREREREQERERVRLPVRDLAMNDANERSRSRPFLIERSPRGRPVPGGRRKGYDVKGVQPPRAWP